MPPSAPRGSRQQRRSLRCSPRAKLCPELPCLVQLLGAHTVTPCSHSAASEGQRLQPSPRAPTAKHEPTPKLSGPAEPRALMSSSRTDPLAAPAPQPVCNSSCNPNPPRAAQLGFLSVWVTFSPQRPGMWQHLFPPPPLGRETGWEGSPHPTHEGRQQHACMRNRSSAGKGRTAAPHTPLPTAEPPRGAGWEPRSSSLPQPFVFAAVGPSHCTALGGLRGDPGGEGSAGGLGWGSGPRRPSPARAPRPAAPLPWC